MGWLQSRSSGPLRGHPVQQPNLGCRVESPQWVGSEVPTDYSWRCASCRGEDAAPRGWWPGLLEVAEESFHGLGGPCPCVCFTQVPCKTPEFLSAHTVASRGSLSFKRSLSPGRNDWEMSRQDPDILSSQKAEALTCLSPLARVRARGGSREHSAVGGGWSLLRACSPGSA